MPSVDVAMARSLKGSTWETLRDSLARSVASSLHKRDIIGDAENKVTDVKTAFSSWDNCMKAAYCKWPVIAIIIVGSLIIFSIAWCCIRCLCCGMSCCCSCFRCFKCCGNCCGCCDPPNGKEHKHLDTPYAPPLSHGYRQEPPMHAFPPASGAPHSHFNNGPQFAEFDVAKKGGEDSLPQMPSWENSNSKKIEVEEEAVEMNNLKKSPQDQFHSPLPSPSLNRSSPRPAHNTPGLYNVPRSNSGRYMSPQTQPQPGHYSPLDHQHGQQPGQPGQSGGTDAGDYGLDQPYDAPAPVAAMAMGRGRASPAPGHYGQMQSNAYEMPAHAVGTPLGRQSPAVGHHPPVDNPATNFNQHIYEAPGHDTTMVGRNSPALGQPMQPPTSHQTPQEQGFVEMPVEPMELPGNDVYAQQPPSPSRRQPQDPAQGPSHGYGMQRQGTGERSDGFGMRRAGTGENAPEGYGMRRAGTSDSVSSSTQRPPYGVDPRMRNSPGPRQSPRPRPGQPFTPSPRGSPAPQNNQSYGRPPPRDAVNRAYSPAPERPIQRTYSPAPGRQRTPAPISQQSSPSSPFTNNAGFDFTSGYSRPENTMPSPTQEAYPGYRPYARG